MPKSLLLADDSITIQKVVGITFTGEDYTITAVDNGEDAIARAKELKPDVILADVVMPRKNGYEVCEAIKADPALKHIPVLLLAGTFEAFDENRARAARADGHIAKPFESQALINKVKELVEGKPAAGPQAAAPQPMVAPRPVVASMQPASVPGAPAPIAGAAPARPAPPVAARPRPAPGVAPGARPPSGPGPRLPSPGPGPRPPGPGPGAGPMAPRSPVGAPGMAPRQAAPMPRPGVPAPGMVPRPAIPPGAMRPPPGAPPGQRRPGFPAAPPPGARPPPGTGFGGPRPAPPAPSSGTRPAPGPATPVARGWPPAPAAPSGPDTVAPAAELRPESPRSRRLEDDWSDIDLTAEAPAASAGPAAAPASLVPGPSLDAGAAELAGVAPSAPARNDFVGLEVPPAGATERTEPAPIHASVLPAETTGHKPDGASASSPAPDGGEALLREAIGKASREVIEKIAWEVVPQLAETIIREHLDRLVKERQDG